MNKKSAGFVPFHTMQYKVVLIFPDSKMLAEFILYLEVPGETNAGEHSFVGILDVEQIRVARKQFGAYVRVALVV